MSRTISIKAMGVSVVTAIVVGALGGYLLTQKPGSQLGIYPVKLTPCNENKPGCKDEYELLVEIEDNGKKCKDKQHNGCMLFEQDEVGLVKFYLDGSKHKTKSCKNAQEVITKIELATAGTDNKGDFDADLDDWISEYAFSGVQDDGVVYEELPLGLARSQVFLVNKNSHDIEDGTKQFWYRVTVTACPKNDDPVDGPWVSDPRGDNKGTNYN